MGGRRVGFGGGFKLLPGAEEARSNEAELEVEDFFLFFFWVRAGEENVWGLDWVWRAGAEAFSRADLASWSAGGVGGRQETDVRTQMSVGRSV